jgi:oligoribonuclease NrnB/cAMP/cGMP phosphodiesterase (DHH superfamily)
MKTALIAYHADCLDGFTAAWVTYKALQKYDFPCELLPMSYSEDSVGDLFEKLKNINCTKLYIVDFSLDIETLSILHLHWPMMITTVLDHHKTAFERYAPNMGVDDNSTIHATIHSAHIILKNSLSGAGICWEYFHTESEPMPPLVQLVQDYDLWLFKLPDTKHINKYLVELEKTLSNWDIVDKSFQSPALYEDARYHGELNQRGHDREVDIVCEDALPITLKGMTGLAVACPRKLTSDVGHTLATKSGTYGAMYTVDLEEGCVLWSLRSNKGDFDVALLAEKFGGGGHEAAAGFRVDLFPNEAVVGESESDTGNVKDVSIL